MTASLSREINNAKKARARVIKTFTKTEIAKILHINRDTVLAYHRIARKYLLDYKDQDIKRAPLTPYQAWCINQIHELMKRMRSYERTQRHLFANRHKYTEQVFNQLGEKS